MDQINPFGGTTDFWPQSNPFFEVKFLNLDKIFYDIYTFFAQLFGGGRRGNLDFDVNAPDLNFRFGGFGGGGSTAGDSVTDFSGFFNFFENLIYFFLILLLTIIIYTIVRMFEIRQREKEYLKEQIAEYKRIQEEKGVGANGGVSKLKNERWTKVLQHLFSDSQADWKLAIIDADSMLDDLMTDLGFVGDNLGEKLKSANRDNFRNLSAAWEAHTVRNKIAHEGLEYDLSIREARRVIALYEQVFREFDYV